MKGIILAGGKGTRLYPMTKVISKQLIPVYDKPMIYYPLSTLLLAGIRDILIISSEKDISMYEELLGNGKKLGINLSYAVQKAPNGIGEAFLIGEKFIGNSAVCLILGDNVFYGQDLTSALLKVQSEIDGATIFGYRVRNPKDFGVIEFDGNNNVISIAEKPQNPPSNWAVPGLYFYDNSIIEICKKIKPSDRGELEITDINREYLKNGKLKVELLGRGVAWLDTGTAYGLLRASEFISTVQERQGFYISCIEEIAWRRGFISHEELMKIGEEMKMTDYGKYILSLNK